MLVFSCLLVAAVSSLAGGASTGGSIGKVLVKLNNTLQTGVSETHNSVDQFLSLGNTTVGSVADLVSSGSDQMSNWAINGMDMGGSLSAQAIDITQDTINGMMNVANNIPITGKIVSVPNGIISKVVNSSLDIGRDAVDAVVGAGEASAAVANVVTGTVANTVASASSAITGKISAVYDKGFGLVSKGINKGVEDTSAAIQKVGGLLTWAGSKLVSSSSSTSTTSTSS